MKGVESAEGNPPLIEVLLATYNGARFLEEQIDSIFQQSYPNFRVLARDDGSDDDTVAILRRYAERHPDRFILIADDHGNLGCTGNFARLVERSTSDYVAFCDQDDVWLPNKLAISMDRMRALERDHGVATPLLVHTDMKAVDQSLHTIGASFWRYQGLRPRHANDLARLLVHNVVTGCTMLMNRPLLKLASPIPPEAKVHDWWVALVAAAFGVTDAIPAPTLLYRQHPGNAIGAKAHGGWRIVLGALRFFAQLQNQKTELRRIWTQGQGFRARYQAALEPQHSTVLTRIVDLPRSGLLTRIACAMTFGGLSSEGLYWIAFALFVPDAARDRTAPPTPVPPARETEQATPLASRRRDMHHS